MSSAVRSSRRTRNRWMPLLMMMPAFVFLVVFVGGSLVRMVGQSFFDISRLTGTDRFVGLANYTNLLSSADFGSSALRTLLFLVIVVTLEFGLGLSAALLFHFVGERSQFLRTVFLYPIMIAPIVAGLLWRFLLIDNFGIVNHLLASVGLMSSPAAVSWLSNPDMVLWSVSIPDIWLTTSFMTLVLFAGLQTIPNEVVEAARIDGARGLRMLLSVRLPLLRPVIAVALIVRGIDATRAFDIMLVETNGGPQNASETMSLLIYRTAVRFGQDGLASAMSVLYMIALAALAIIAVRFIWRQENR